MRINPVTRKYIPDTGDMLAADLDEVIIVLSGFGNGQKVLLRCFPDRGIKAATNGYWSYLKYSGGFVEVK